VKYLQQSAVTSVLQTMSSTQQWVILRSRMQIKPERDHGALEAAVRKGKITVCQESTPS
jgi:hypothetical protein